MEGLSDILFPLFSLMVFTRRILAGGSQKGVILSVFESFRCPRDWGAHSSVVPDCIRVLEEG